MNKEDGKKLADEMVKYILTKKPSDLSSGHDGDWFQLNDKNQVNWNWRYRALPFRALYQKLMETDAEMKARYDAISDVWAIDRFYYDVSNKVLNCKAIKDKKETYRVVDEVRNNLIKRRDQIEDEMKRLVKEREGIEMLLIQQQVG